MSDEGTGFCAGLAIGALFAGVITGCVLNHYYENDAIEAGVAEWRIDAKTGERSFHWIGKDER